MVFDFYAESVCFQHVADPVMASARWSPVTMFTCALSLTYVCHSGQGLEEHSVTSGVIITVSASILGATCLILLLKAFLDLRSMMGNVRRQRQFL
ncbi:unnamed protein product [Heligmosomoides polygyrus]|uniref:CASP-like protein n=1 Tax=Heligmosomoides polygyrus TaxID=6339 RepID=A0A183GPG3_HELPZ|nr:unnamed protein product [Heligmosomoides polygyrus]